MNYSRWSVMYFSTSIFLTVLGTSLAYLPDPDHCCESVKINKSETSLINGEVFKLDSLKEYLVYFPRNPTEEYSKFEITYDVEDEEWHLIASLVIDGYSSYLLKYSSNSTDVCPENAETWDQRNGWMDAPYLGVSEMKLVCYQPFYKKYWYVILIACILVVLLFCYFCCGRLSKKNEKSENAAMEVHIEHENGN